MSKENVETGYCTKYALTAGIKKVVVSLEREAKSGFVYTVPENNMHLSNQLKRGKDYFKKREDAVQNAKIRADVEITMLEKRIQRLQVLVKHPRMA